MTPSPPPSRRILFVDHAAVLGGAELSLLDIAAAFHDKGAVALFEDGPFVGALAAKGVTVIQIRAGRALRNVKKTSRVPSPSAIAATSRAAFDLANVARQFDVIYANSPKSFLVSAAAGLLAHRAVIWHLRDILDRGHFSGANVRVMVAAANRRAACVVANSHATADAFVAAGGRRDLVRVVHNGIDPQPFDVVAPGARAAVRAELGVDADAFVVGSFSRLHAWKGQRILLDAVAAMADVQVILAGGALFSGEAEYEEELRAMAATPPLAGRVHILGARNDVPRLMSACDVVAHTSVLPEPFGRVLVEALLAKRALVASDAGGVREIVEDGVTAILTPPGDATRLAQALLLLRDPALRARLAATGSGDVRRRFTRDAMLAGVRAAIAEVSVRPRT